MSEVVTEVHKSEKKVEPPFSGPLASYEAWLYDMVYEKVSFKIPVSAREWLVKYGPWVTLVIGLLFLPVLLGVFAVSAVVSTASVYSAYVAATVGPMYYISMILLAVQLVVMFVSVSPLLKRKRSGWQLLFYSSTLSLLYSVFYSFSYGFSFFSLLGGVIGAAVSYYVIFQIRSYYK